MAEGLSAAAAIVAAVIALLAWLSARSAAARAGTIETRSNTIAEDANRIAKEASTSASEANRIAAESVEQARRSAAAAEESLALQRREAEEAAQHRTNAGRAKLLPVAWQPRRRVAESPFGIQVKNYSTAVAKNVRIYVRLRNGEVKMALTENVGPSTLIGAYDELQPYSPITGLDGMPNPVGAQVAARVVWENEDGTEGKQDWTIVSHI